MALHTKLLQILLLWLLIYVCIAASQVVIRPDCQDKCGNVTIPYPFGTRRECFLDDNYWINCNSSSSPPKPLLRKGNIEVTNISLDAGELHIRTSVAWDCYDKQGVRDDNRRTSTGVALFPFSTTRNKFTAVGCDIYAVILGKRGDNTSVATGCLSLCSNISSVTNGSCSGVGCCQTSIPGELLHYSLSVTSFNNHSGILDFNPCSYSFLVEEDSYNFTMADLSKLRYGNYVPSVLDWAIGHQNCEAEIKNATTYACKENSVCEDSPNGPGYRCKCSPGYKGNPYLTGPGGCQDIDECADPKLNKCQKKQICMNTPGNYSCSCIEGYQWDGREGGQGCIANQSGLIKVTIGNQSGSISLVTKVTIGIGIGLIALLVGGSWLYWGLKKRRLIELKEKFFRQNGGLMLQQQLSSREGYSEAVKIFTADELEKATNNYDESRIIGRGGFGTVYKGLLADKRIIAIKKSKIVDQNQIEQFINEVVVLSRINHRNVVKLLGCCLETDVPSLVYEFISNGTLFEHIHNQSKASAMSWEIRLRIATETAGVLSYLHSAASIPIIHRDVKSTNILLDDNYTAKVSDFGASRIVPLDQTQLATMVQGTLGYLDPEYMQTNQLTEKSDVYSFGVVLVELLTGKKALSFDRPEEERSLAMHFLLSLKEDRLFQVLENCVVNEGNNEQLKEVANLARMCLRVKGEERPTMKEVAMELEGLRMMGKHPWVEVEANSKETEYLLGDSSDNFNHGANGNNRSVGYDSLRDHVILPVSDGR